MFDISGEYFKSSFQDKEAKYETTIVIRAMCAIDHYLLNALEIGQH